MADLQLMPGEYYIHECDTVFFNGKAFPPRGKLALTNMRIVFMKVSTGAYLALGPLLAQAVPGKPEFEVPLSEVAGAVPTKQRGNRCLTFTLRDGRTLTFAAHKKWQESFFGLSNQPPQ